MQEALPDASDADEGGSESELAGPSKGATRSNNVRRRKKTVKNTDDMEEGENGHQPAAKGSPFPDMDSRPRLSPTKTYSLKRKRREEAAAAALANGDTTLLTDDSEMLSSTPKKTSASSSPPRKAPAVKKKGGGSEKEKVPVKEKPKPKPTIQVSVSLDLSGLGLDDESDLTPLSESDTEPEPEPSPKPAVVAKAKTANGNHSSPGIQVRGHPMFTAPSTSTSTSKTAKAKGGRPKSSWEVKEEKEEDEWNREDLGTFVWVRLDGKNSKTAGVYTTRSKSKESLWWPASVHSSGSKGALKVKLFGNSSRTIAIEEPSSDNTRPRLKNFSLRFDSYEAAFQGTVHRGPSVASGSPRKKQKLEDENKAAWDAALREMQEAFLDSDDLPHPMEALTAMSALGRTGSSSTVAPNGSTNGKGRGKRKRRQSEEQTDPSDEEREHEPPLENEDLDIPGELVLARSAKTSLNEYWPAKLLDYVPPKKKEKEGKYKIVFLDTTQEAIPRKFFYIQSEDGFLTCKLGQIQSAVVDDTNDLEEEEIDPEFLIRSPSPPCRNPPPDQNKFVTLALREQFAYVKPILQAILHNQYKPTEKKVRVFMSGTSRQQANLSKVGSDRGMMDPRQVNELLVYLKHWCLRGDQNVQPRALLDLEDAAEPRDVAVAPASAEPGPSIRLSSPTPTEVAFESSPPVEPPPSSSFSPLTTQDEPVEEGPPRQIGSPEYEALSPLQRLDFCLNILLLEAIRQILLWRAGARRSMRMLSPEEEEELYEEGEKLLQERDWVHDVLRVRQRLNGMGAKTDEDGQAKSRSGRRTKTVNYAE
ncbi:hypothetical protein EST38_g3051 [Candolleomyces aberdarensis]|uniref:Uncharacterized protein n=1 Tax=Candolleomyces aberdarensis TaxID=2316362 RepID=A0A4Q2DV56_9AGAR|nr:hypothetical protein EST38_g3051 [Candolleomyces aberdarensis]